MSSPQSRKKHSVREDRITNLPTEIKEKILIYLPLKDAIKTSLLSSKWRYTWITIPELVLRDEDFFTRSKKYAEINKFTNFVDNLLSLHNGSIHKFTISTKLSLSGVLERWLTVLTRKTGIQELDLKLASSASFFLPSSFLEFHALNRVNLRGCAIILPKKFEGFKFLNHLKLKNCIILESGIQELVSNSPNLKYFSLKHYVAISTLKIISPNLEELGIKCVIKNLQLETPNLQRLRISNSSIEVLKNCSANNASFKGIKNLDIDCDYLHSMADSINSRRNNNIFEHLNKLSIYIDFKSQYTILDFSLLRNAPHLQILHIWLRYSTEPEGTILDLINTNKILFENLNTIVIHGSVESESVLEFLRFLLIKSPNLKIILLRKNDPLILQKLIKSEKASKDAKLIVQKVKCSVSCSSLNPYFANY